MTEPIQWQRDMLSNIPVITEQECKRAQDSIDALRSHWQQRHPTVPFYTLGASNYFDIAYNPELPYYRIAAELNSVLLDELGWLYDRVRDQLEECLDAPVDFQDKLAIPGFHVILSHPAIENPRPLTHQQWFKDRENPEYISSPVHCDTPHHVVNWGTPQSIDMTRPISITMPIAMPASGAGMYVWDVGLDDTQQIAETDLLDYLDSQGSILHEYELGAMALHSGLRYHHLAPTRDVQSGDARITMQGHGVFCDGAWRLFW